jgi:hypothetical protein
MPHCAEKGLLLEAYRAATAAFSDQLTMLNEKIGTSSKAEYEALRRSVDGARVKSEEARLALERHVGEHGC